MIDGIHHTCLTVSDMERSVAFYRDLLELRLIFDTASEGIRLEGPVADAVTGCPGTSQRVVYFAAGRDLFELVEYRPPGKPLVDRRASDCGTTHVCFLTDDIDSVYRRLQAAGVPVHSAPQWVGDAQVFYFRDPDGLILEAMGGKPLV